MSRLYIRVHTYLHDTIAISNYLEIELTSSISFTEA